MKTRLFTSLVFALVFGLTFVVASEKDKKATKSTTEKKATMGCCATSKTAKKDAQACEDKAMLDCDTKDAKASKSTKSEAKAEVKTEKKETK